MPRQLLFILAALLFASAPASAGEGPKSAVIYFSFAPWDGAAYELQIPLPKTEEAADPVIRVNIWDNPEFEKPQRLKFTGTEDGGGRAAKR